MMSFNPIKPTTMNKDIKDFIHLYLGCEVMYKDDRFILLGYNKQLKECTIEREESYSIVTAIKQVDEVELILRPLSDMTEEEINNVCSILLDRETTCGKIWRSDEKDFIIATFKQEKPLPPYDKQYKSMDMGIYIKDDFQVDYKWAYYTEENCEGSCGITTEPLHNHNEITRYLLSKHFDVFGLIEAGLAIDKNKLNNHE